MTAEQLQFIFAIGYLVAAVLFIFGLKQMAHPRTAVRGNLLGATGMLLAVVIALVSDQLQYPLIITGLVIGALVGAVFAIKVQMTSMPQLVALFNGFGGVASVLVAGAALYQSQLGTPELIATALTGVIGAVTFLGSVIAFGKLQELKIFKKPFSFPGQQIINAGLALGLVALTVMLVTNGGDTTLYWVIVLVCCVYVWYLG